MSPLPFDDILKWLEKSRHYCGNQERCSFEIERKLESWGCDPGKINAVIRQLVKEKTIDEQRFANDFARGKFRIKKWGKLKITAALHQFKIPETLMHSALSKIDDRDYRATLKDVLEKKWETGSGELQTRIHKVATFAIGKGYESSLVFEVLKTINKE